MITTDPATGLPVIEFDGPRLLAKLPPVSEERKKLTRFADAKTIVPRNEWVTINRRSHMTEGWLLDQRSHGSCVGFSSAAALMRARALNGSATVRLSGAFVYSWINGGRDAGAIITDALDVLRDKGTCPEEEAPWDAIYPNRYPESARKSAMRFRLLEAYTADTFDEIGSAIQLGYIPIFAVQVGGTFVSISSEGICGFDRGPGNHAVHADGMSKLSRGWCLDMPNSWGKNFGQGGRGFVTEEHIDGVQQDCYVIRAAVEDPQEPNSPPNPK